MSNKPWPGPKRIAKKIVSDGQYLAACEILKIALENYENESDEVFKKKLIETFNIYIRILDAIQKGEIIDDLKLD
jgi:hypothetical protein